jgi:hypothetical protein
MNIHITGPGNAKTTLKSFIDKLHPTLASRVFAMETLDHPDTDGLLALGRRYFHDTAPTP